LLQFIQESFDRHFPRKKISDTHSGFNTGPFALLQQQVLRHSCAWFV